MKATNDAVNNPVVDTYNWDTAFALNFDNANAAIVKKWPSISDKAKDVSQAADDMPSWKVTGVLKPWQLAAGGDGKNVRMRCTFDSGEFDYGSGKLDLATGDGQPVAAIIEVGMQWVPEPDQKFFVIADNATVNTIKADLDNHKIDSAIQACFSAHGVTLASTALVTPKEPGKEWLIEADADDDYYVFLTTDEFGSEFLQVYKFQDDWENVLQLLSTAVGDDEPPVTIVSVAGDSELSSIPRAALEELLSTWFTANLAEFNHVFASISLAPTLSKTAKYAWIKPTGTGYAVVDEGASSDSIFGVLNTALHHEIPTNHQVSPNAIPDGADAGFAIAGTDFVEQMMLEGARKIFNEAPGDAFSILNDGLSVTNTEKVVWGKFMMDEKKEGAITKDWATTLDKGGDVSRALWQAVSIAGVDVPSNAKIQVTAKGSQWLLSNGDNSSTEAILDLNGDQIDVYEATILFIEKGNFKLSLVNSYVEIQFIDLYYSYSSSFDVHVNYTEQVQLTLLEKKGKKIFWFDQIERDMTVTVTKTKIAITREIVEGAVTACLGLVAVAGPILDGLSAAADIGTVTEDGGEAVIDAEAFAAADEANPAEAAEDAEASGAEAAEQESGKMASIKRAFNTPKWKFMGALAGVSAAISGLDVAISAIIEAAAKNEWEKVPGFDEFANTLIKPYTFPDVDSFDLHSAHLQQSLVVGFKINRGS